MKSMSLRVSLAFVSCLLGPQLTRCWMAGFPESEAAAQTVAAQLPQAAQATQATQLRPQFPNAAAAGQPLRMNPSQMFNQGANKAAGPNNGSTTASMEGSLLNGDERFLRRNRKVGAFVGADSQDLEGTSGKATGAAGDAGLAGTGPNPALRGPRTGELGLGTEGPAKPTRAYPPRLTVAFERAQAAQAEFSAKLTRRLTKTPGLHPGNQIAVSVADEIATLQGVVASERDRTLIEKMLLFEPGIAAVQNDLKVSPDLPLPEPIPSRATRSAQPLGRKASAAATRP